MANVAIQDEGETSWISDIFDGLINLGQGASEVYKNFAMTESELDYRAAQIKALEAQNAQQLSNLNAPVGTTNIGSFELSNNAILLGGGAILLLIAAYFIFKK